MIIGVINFKEEAKKLDPEIKSAILRGAKSTYMETIKKDLVINIDYDKAEMKVRHSEIV